MDNLEQLILLEESPLQPEEIFQHLCYISDKLTQHKIKHWIAYGTLLGSIREKGIIKYDYDFDLGIFYEDLEKILDLNEFIKIDGYFLEKGSGVVYNPFNKKESQYKWRVSLKLKYEDKAIGDLYIYKLFDDGFLRRYDEIEKIYYYPNSTFPYYFVEELMTTEIFGRLFPSPKHPEILIEHFYGPLWQIPFKALSQGGSSHPDYDYYGNYKFSNLNFLIQFLKIRHNIELKPDLKYEMVKYIFPLEQLEWIKENEKLLFKLKNIKMEKEMKNDNF